MARPSRISNFLVAACCWAALLVAITHLAHADAPAAQPSPPNIIVEQAVKQGFLVFSVTTDLQRLLAGYVPRKGEKLRAFVALNGTLLLDKEGQFVPNALDVDAIRRALAPLKDAEHAVVQFSPYFHALTKWNKEFDDQARKFLQDVGISAGFHRANVVFRMDLEGLDIDAWRQTITAVADADGGTPDAEEPAVGSDIVKVYRVWTFLSRLLSRNSDCVVDVTVPFTGDGAESLTAKIWETVKTEVENIDLDSRDKIQFRVMAQNFDAARNARDRFVQNEARRLALAVGFTNCTTFGGSFE